MARDGIIKTAHSARLRLDHGEDCAGCQDIGLQMALHIVALAGWRIVRTDDADTFDPPADYVWTRDSDDPPDWDRSGVFYHDEARPEGCTPLWRISDEWTPAAGVAAPEGDDT